MRDFTDSEIARLLKGDCPACGVQHETYWRGPQGGVCENITTECGVRMNVPTPEGGWPPRLPFGQMLDDHPEYHAPPPPPPPKPWWKFWGSRP